MKYKYRIKTMKSLSNDGLRSVIHHQAQCKNFIFWKDIVYSYGYNTEAQAMHDIRTHKNKLKKRVRCGIIKV
mgnify:CR=1 FL=1